MRDEVVRTDQAQGGLVCVVEPLTPDLAMQLGDLLHGALVVGGAVLGLTARKPGQGLLRGFELAGSCGGAPLSTVRDYIDNQKRPA